MRKEFLSLIGCGWLGEKLAASLLATSHFSLTVTTRKKPPHLLSGVDFVPLDLTLPLAAPPQVITSDLLIYLVPPLPLLNVKHFFDQIASDTPILFMSSVSIYGKCLGEVDEKTPLAMNNTGSPLLWQTEEYLKARFKKATILRLGGLYGEGRHPLFSIQGKTGLTNGREYLHLVHQDDVIRAICAIVYQKMWGEVFNIVSSLEMSKEEYYTALSKKWNLASPLYSTDLSLKRKETKISNEKSKKLLGLQYRNPCDFTP